MVSSLLAVDVSTRRIQEHVFFVPDSVPCSLGILEEQVWSWKEASGPELLGSPGKPQDEDQQRPRGWIGGWQKGFNDVEAKREPKQFMERERTLTKQNFRVIRLNSWEAARDGVSHYYSQNSCHHRTQGTNETARLTGIFFSQLGACSGKGNTEVSSLKKHHHLWRQDRKWSTQQTNSSRSTVG